MSALTGITIDDATRVEQGTWMMKPAAMKSSGQIGIGGGWARRHVWFQANAVHYGPKEKKSEKNVPLGEINDVRIADIAQVAAEKGPEKLAHFAFWLVAANKTILFCAENEADRALWIRVLSSYLTRRDGDKAATAGGSPDPQPYRTRQDSRATGTSSIATFHETQSTDRRTERSGSTLSASEGAERERSGDTAPRSTNAAGGGCGTAGSADKWGEDAGLLDEVLAEYSAFREASSAVELQLRQQIIDRDAVIAQLHEKLRTTTTTTNNNSTSGPTSSSATNDEQKKNTTKKTEEAADAISSSSDHHADGLQRKITQLETDVIRLERQVREDGHVVQKLQQDRDAARQAQIIAEEDRVTAQEELMTLRKKMDNDRKMVQESEEWLANVARRLTSLGELKVAAATAAAAAP